MTDLGDLGGSALRSVLERVGRGVSRVQERKPLGYDLLESDDAYLVVFDAPGAGHSDVQVRFLDGEVQVRVDRFRDFHEGFEMRFPGRGLALSGRANLPGDAVVDPDGAAATLADNGTLRVRIPKAETSRDVPVGEAADDGPETVDVDEGADAGGDHDGGGHEDSEDAESDRDHDDGGDHDADA